MQFPLSKFVRFLLAKNRCRSYCKFKATKDGSVRDPEYEQHQMAFVKGVKNY